MFWTVLGLLIATAVSIEEVVTSEKSHQIKVLVALLAVVGLGVGAASAVSENRDKRSAEDEVRYQKRLLEVVNATVGDLGKLNQLSSGQKYYVRIAAGRTEEELTPPLERIKHEFPGAEPNHLAAIRKPRAGSGNYELVFGQDLNPAAAEVFSRLATISGFTPNHEPAEMFREPD